MMRAARRTVWQGNARSLLCSRQDVSDELDGLLQRVTRRRLRTALARRSRRASPRDRLADISNA
jgi:hypothetical protein